MPGGPGQGEDHSDAQVAWHPLDESQALSLLGVDWSGLSSTEAARRLAAHGRPELENLIRSEHPTLCAELEKLTG